MNHYTAIIKFQTTDKPQICCLEALMDNIVKDHGLQIDSVRVQPDCPTPILVTDDNYDIIFPNNPHDERNPE